MSLLAVLLVGAGTILLSIATSLIVHSLHWYWKRDKRENLIERIVWDGQGQAKCNYCGEKKHHHRPLVTDTTLPSPMWDSSLPPHNTPSRGRIFGYHPLLCPECIKSDKTLAALMKEKKSK